MANPLVIETQIEKTTSINCKTSDSLNNGLKTFLSKIFIPSAVQQYIKVINLNI